jgi:hypothetical protein
MTPTKIFLIDMALGYLAWALCIAAYVWPRLRAMDRVAAQRAIATLHSFRFFGLVFLLPGFVGPNLPQAFRSRRLRRLRRRPARHPGPADCARAFPLLAIGPGLQSGRPRRPGQRHSDRDPDRPALHGRPAWGGLRDPHALRAGAFLDPPAGVVAAAAACARRNVQPARGKPWPSDGRNAGELNP